MPVRMHAAWYNSRLYPGDLRDIRDVSRPLIASGPTGCTTTVDPLVMTQLSNPNDKLYYPDGIHIGDQGSGVYAHFMASVLAPYLH